MLTTMLVAAVLSALGVFALNVGLSNLKNTTVDRNTLQAMGAAEAGVTQALGYLRANGVRVLACSPTCPANPWGNSSTPQSLTLSGGTTALVWVEKVQEFAPPTYLSGTYLVHSAGKSQSGASVRSVAETVNVSPYKFPLGIYSEQKISFQGNGAIVSESIFANSCIDSRGYDHLLFQGTDSYYGLPAAAHSTSFITTNQVNSCSPLDSGAIHLGSNTPCNTTTFTQGSLKYDQDAQGGTLPAGSPCLAPGVTTSHFDLPTLVSQYGYKPRGLTTQQYAALKAQAQAAGTYYTGSPPTWPQAATSPNPVLYFKLSAGQEVQLGNSLSSYAWATNDPSCTQVHPAVVIVVEGGNLHITGTGGLAGALLVPDGTITFDNATTFVGTTFSQQIIFAGNDTFSLNDCYTKNTPNGILDPKAEHFHEVDR